MEDYQKYIDNVKTIRNLSKVIVNENDDNQTIISKIKNNAKDAYEYKVWNDEFLDSFLYSKKVEDLSEDDIKNILGFIDAVFNYSDSLDSGISFKLFEKLLEYAKYNNDLPMYIKELYNTGIAIFYLDTKEDSNGESLFQKRMSKYFEEGSSYLDKFKEFDDETKSYIIRCLGNKKIGVNRSTDEGVKKYYQIYDYSINIMNSDEYRELAPNLKWDVFEYGMNMDQLSIVPYLRTHRNKEVANRVLDAATYVYNADLNDNMYQEMDWRIGYYYKVAQYHAGKASIGEVVKELGNIVKSTDMNDTSLDGMNANLTAKAYLLYYANQLPKKEKQEVKPLLEQDIKNAYVYLDKLPGEYYRRTVSDAVRELVDMQTEVSENDKADMMNYLVAFHKPTYVHSLMVALLTKTLCEYLINSKPECLIGVLNTKASDGVIAKKDEILDLAYNCGIYHDLGKNMCMSYININERKLIDEEFECIKTHPKAGYELLIKNKDNENYALAALYHHVYYDGSNGYPEKINKCPSYIKPIVDVLTVADSIDAATDSIGRHYKYPKTLDQLIDEFRSQSGTRYAPFAVELFNDKKIVEHIEDIITNERINIYLDVYNKGKEYTVSSYIKETS